MPAYVEALAREVAFYGQRDPGAAVQTVYFGGGTPSLLAPEHFNRVINAIRSHFALAEDAEITIEANPGSLAPELLATLKSLGVNRISLGVQSSTPEELKALIAEKPSLRATDAST